MIDGSDRLADRIEALLGRRPTGLRPLKGGSTVAVVAAELEGGKRLVAKWGQGHQEVERWMLEILATETDVPVPAVLGFEPMLLLLDWVEHDEGPRPPSADEDLAGILAALHAEPRAGLGLARDTVLGRIRQPNPPGGAWPSYFARHRLLAVAEEGEAEGTIPPRIVVRISRLAAKIDGILDEPPHPAMLHGDLWTGNILHRQGRIAALLDPALGTGHPELDLAMLSMFGTVGPRFFEAYRERSSLDLDGFFGPRRDTYLLWPLLVHARYWDREYLRDVDAILRRLGIN